MYKEDFTINNLQWLICHKTKPNFSILTTSELLAKNNYSYPTWLTIVRILSVAVLNMRYA